MCYQLSSPVLPKLHSYFMLSAGFQRAAALQVALRGRVTRHYCRCSPRSSNPSSLHASSLVCAPRRQQSHSAAYIANIYGVQLAISHLVDVTAVINKVSSADESGRALRASRWFPRVVREGVIFSLRPQDATSSVRSSFVSVSHTGACIFVDVQLVDALYILELIREVTAESHGGLLSGGEVASSLVRTIAEAEAEAAPDDVGLASNKNSVAPLSQSWSLSAPPEAALHHDMPNPTVARRRPRASAAAGAALNNALALENSDHGSTTAAFGGGSSPQSAGSDASLLLLTKARDMLSLLVDPALPVMPARPRSAAASGSNARPLPQGSAIGFRGVSAAVSTAAALALPLHGGLSADLRHGAHLRGVAQTGGQRRSPAIPSRSPSSPLSSSAMPLGLELGWGLGRLAVRRLDLDAVRTITCALSRSLALQRAEQFAERELLPRVPALSAAAENGRILLAPDGSISVTGAAVSAALMPAAASDQPERTTPSSSAAPLLAMLRSFVRLLRDAPSSGGASFQGTYAASAALAYRFIASCKRLQTALLSAHVAGPVRPSDAAWGDTELGRLYEALADDLELEARHDALHRRLDYACEVAQFAADANWDSRMEVMTWQIIFLLAFSCLLKLAAGS